MTFSQLLWYTNNGYLVFVRCRDNWSEWHPETGYDSTCKYKVVSEKAWEQLK